MSEEKFRLFKNDDFGEIRTVKIDGEPWFVAKDVCDILGIKNPTDALNKGLEDFERARFNLGRQGEANVISESGFYTLVLRSRKSIAKPFRIWVTKEVLPEIRKTGQYVAPAEDTMQEKLGDLFTKQTEIENHISSMEDKLDSVMENMTVTVRQQQNLYKAAKDRVNYLLGGAHSERYKKFSRSYFINLWNNFKAEYGCSSYKDLNPKYYDEAFRYISSWRYVTE